MAYPMENVVISDPRRLEESFKVHGVVHNNSGLFQYDSDEGWQGNKAEWMYDSKRSPEQFWIGPR